MVIASNLKHAICALFEVHSDSDNVQRIVTPLEYPGSSDRIVVRVRSTNTGIALDENGEAALYSTMAGGDISSELVARWASDLSTFSPAHFDFETETISIITEDQRLVAPYIFRIAEAAQQLYSISTARADRQASDFKDRVSTVIEQTARKLDVRYKSNFELPIAGGLMADHYLETPVPMIVIAATSVTRLLEAEVIHMQYKMNQKPGFVLAIAESQAAVGKRQFERANYYTGKTVSFNPHDLEQLVTLQAH